MSTATVETMRLPMSDKTHVTDLLQAAKLLADSQQNVMLELSDLHGASRGETNPEGKNRKSGITTRLTQLAAGYRNGG